MEKSEEQLRKRFIELANEADKKGIVTFSDFLNLNELNIFHTVSGKLSYVTWERFGGYETAERQLIAFIPDALYYDWEYPVTYLAIKPVNKKFAEPLNHRDYLGTILNLGIDRGKIGDILVTEEGAYVCCMNAMFGFISRELTRIRHTTVLCQKTDQENLILDMRKECIQGTVASIRLDSVIALGCKSSRSSLIALIEGGKVFVNGKAILSNGYPLKENDKISVRGIGKFCYCGILSETKKGRYYIELEKYI